MDDPNPFAALLARVRAGDPDAAAELVRRYEPAIRVVVRANLVDPTLRRHFDSMDVCQSVLGSFFVRAAAGQFDLSEPGQLVGLLVTMTRNKLSMQARRLRQAKRDVRRTAADGRSVSCVQCDSTRRAFRGSFRPGPTASRATSGGRRRETASP